MAAVEKVRDPSIWLTWKVALGSILTYSNRAGEASRGAKGSMVSVVALRFKETTWLTGSQVVPPDD